MSQTSHHIPGITPPEKHDCFTIGVHTICCHDEVRVLEFDRACLLRLTPIEYQVMRTLLSGRPVDDQSLAAIIFASPSDFWVQEALEKHITNIRRKLKERSVPLYIYRLARYGHVLAPTHRETNRY